MGNEMFLWPQIIFARHTLTMSGSRGSSQRGRCSPGAGGRREAGPCALRRDTARSPPLGRPGQRPGTPLFKWQHRDRRQAWTQPRRKHAKDVVPRARHGGTPVTCEHSGRGPTTAGLGRSRTRTRGDTAWGGGGFSPRAW